MIKMKTINVDGVEITKEVEESLYSQYLRMGWTEVKEDEKKVIKPINLSKTKEEPKEEVKEEK